MSELKPSYYTVPTLPVNVTISDSVLPLTEMEEVVIRELRDIREKKRHTLLVMRWEFDAWRIYEAAPVAKVIE